MFWWTTVIVHHLGSNICMTNVRISARWSKKTRNKKFQCITTVRHASHSLLGPDKLLTPMEHGSQIFWWGLLVECEHCSCASVFSRDVNANRFWQDAGPLWTHWGAQRKQARQMDLGGGGWVYRCWGKGAGHLASMGGFTGSPTAPSVGRW